MKIPFKLLMLTFIVPLITIIPLVIGYASTQAPNQIFMGFDFIDDFHYYASFIYSYSQEPLDLFIENRSTSEPQDGRFFFPLFWITGIISTLTGIPLAFTIVRYLLAIIMYVGLWHVLGYVFEELFWRKTAYALSLLGTGFGWIFWTIGQFVPVFSRLYTTDLTYSLGFNLFGTLTFPLLLAGQALFFFGLLLLLRFMEKPTKKDLLLFGIVIAFEFFIHPISFITFIPVFFTGMTFFLIQHPNKEMLKKIFPIVFSFIGGIILAGTYFWWAIQDSVYYQNVFAYGVFQRMIEPFWWLLGYGLILVFALLGLRHLQIRNEWMHLFFWAWLITILLLSLNPWKGMRFQFALFVPLIRKSVV